MAIKNRNLKKGIYSSFLIGWRIETNWGKPFSVLLVRTARPISSALILSFMYTITSQGTQKEDLLWVLIGISTWGFVQNQVEFMYWAIVSEREWLRNIKNVIISPTPFIIYLTGRSSAGLPFGLFSFTVILLTSNLLLDLGITFSTIYFPYLFLAIFLSFIILFFLGLLTAGITLSTPKYPIGVGEALVGVLYLISGSIVRPEILPNIFQNISINLPLSHLINLYRYALSPSFRTASYDWNALIFTGLIFSIFGFLVYSFSFYRARSNGKIDQQTMY